MALTSLILLVVFTAFYFNRTLEKKPAPLARLAEKLEPHMAQVGYWGAIYGLAVMLLTLVFRYSSFDMLIRLVANFVIVVMALPFVADKVIAVLREKVKNPAIVDEAQSWIGWISKNEKIVSYIGAGCAGVLFFVLFR